MIAHNSYPSRRQPPEPIYRHQHQQHLQLHNQELQHLQPLQNDHQYNNYSHNYNYTYGNGHSQPQLQHFEGLLATSDSGVFPTTLDNSPTIAAAQAALDSYQKKFDFLNIQSPMSSEPLLFHDQPISKQAQAQRFSHQRDTSSSSVGSNTPASPYSANTANPRIAVSDATGAGLHDVAAVGDNSYTYTITNDQSHAGSLGPIKGRGGGMNALNVMGDLNTAHALPGLMGAQQQRQGGLAHASGRSAPCPSTKSRPMSVASSICGGDSPATPPYREHEDEHRRIKNAFDSGASIPRLDRTATDAYYDELLPQELTMTPSSPPPQGHTVRSPTSDLFAQRIQAANRQHLHATQSPVSSRAHSPFVQGSPYALAVNELPKVGTNQARLESAQQLRERRKAEDDATQLQHRMAQTSRSEAPQDTPATISPKDAVLEFNEAEVESDFPLFPAHEANTDGLEHNNGSGNLMDRSVSQHSASPFQSMSGTPVQSNFKYELPSHVQVMPQYPFVHRQQPQPQRPQQQISQSAPTFSRVSSAEASNTDIGSHDRTVRRPDHTGADGGTYTCTYHGCTLRFDTQAQLQKHKREGHRQANVFNHLRSPAGLSNSALSSQAGPHRCDRINPSTGKPCNTIFSRPYDLTRHEDTIHNGRKQKVRCHLCTEEKTFSRADALTRHYRVCHPDIPSPTKRRRAVV
ncbi:hypothetical protein GGS21DRAFT_284238 [Xylaria nigripes]|nr:hypothetical protein GGS21DRAFT_284238 [Xylaria nigripes]